MAESKFALFTTELIKNHRPLRSIKDIELATLERMWWFKNHRLHSERDYRTLAEVEAENYAKNTLVLATAIHGKPQGTKPSVIHSMCVEFGCPAHMGFGDPNKHGLKCRKKLA